MRHAFHRCPNCKTAHPNLPEFEEVRCDEPGCVETRERQTSHTDPLAIQDWRFDNALGESIPAGWSMERRFVYVGHGEISETTKIYCPTHTKARLR